MYKEIDLNTWNRREIYDYFKTVKTPHYALAANVDVTRLLEFKRKHHLSFYLSLIFLATDVLNDIDNFRMRMTDGRPVIYDEIHPDLTHKKADEEIFHIYYARYEKSLEQFVAHTQAAIDRQTTLFAGEDASPAQIHFSCNPAVDATAITNPGLDDPEDAAPRVNWGKYVNRDGRWIVNITITPNHRFIDGYHVGLFFNRLQQRIDAIDV